MSGFDTIASNSSGIAGSGCIGLDTVITSFTPNCPWGIGTSAIAPAWYNDVTVTFTGLRATQAD